MINLFNYSKKQIKKIEKDLKSLNKYEEDLKNLENEDLKKIILENKKNKDFNIAKVTAILKIITNRIYKIDLFDKQLIAGIVLNKGSIIEMKTGEGKTFSAMLTALLSFLNHEKIYIATANEYLSKRDSEITEKVLKELGLKVSYLSNQQKLSEKIQNYKSDVIYGTIQMFAFDYLKDNLSYQKEVIMQKNKDFILIDEADLSLIDQARTPLSLTGDEKRDDVTLYKFFTENKFLNEEEKDFEYDKESRIVTLLDSGFTKLELFLIENKFISSKEEMYLSKNLHYLHIVNNILKAEYIYKEDIDYVISDEEVVVIDEKTGRLSEGRRFGNGLHQAIEAKEDLEIQKESNTIASITIQNYLKKFKKISGMSGTAKTEEREFKNTYGLKVVEIPTNKKMIREDYQDIIFSKKEAKLKAILEDVKEKHKTGRPILIGTNSIESSMELGDLLYKAGLKYKLLNAKHHQKESEIISNAGTFNSITIATNMAGRGTDIMLGGNREDFINTKLDSMTYEEAKLEWEKENKKINDLGGLYIIGAERNITRRMDNQLIGRAGRQGDAGGSQFFISLEDEIIKDYGLQKIQKIWSALGIKEDEAVSNPTVDMNIASIQKRIESANEEARKMVLSFDDINEEQRNIIYELRDKILYTEDSNKLNDFILNFTKPQIAKMVEKFINDSYPEEYWDFKGLEEYAEKVLTKKIDIKNWFKSDTSLQISDIIDRIVNEFLENLKEKEKELKDKYIVMQKEVILKVIDEHWSQQLSSLAELKNRVFFRSYAQQKPLEEYQKEIYYQFKEKINNIEEDLILSLSHFKIVDKKEMMLKHFRYGLSPLLGVGI